MALIGGERLRGRATRRVLGARYVCPGKNSWCALEVGENHGDGASRKKLVAKLFCCFRKRAENNGAGCSYVITGEAHGHAHLLW